MLKEDYLRTFKDRGYNNLYGIEPSEDAINNLHHFGIEGKYLSLFEANSINRKFDVKSINSSIGTYFRFRKNEVYFTKFH